MMVFRKFALTAAMAGVVSLTNVGSVLAHTSRDPLEAAPTAPAASAKLEGARGEVRELIIEDHVAGMTMRHLSMVPDSGAPVALIGKEVDQLVAGQSVTVTGRRNGNLLFVDTLHVGKATSVVAQATEHVEGNLAVAHVDNFETGKSEYLYEVRGDDGSVTGLNMAVAPEALQAGMRVRAHGNRATATDSLQPSRVEILALSSTSTTTTSGTTALATTAKATTMHTVLVVALKFTDTATDPATIASLQNLMISAPDSVTNFYREASYGQQQLSVTVPGAWLHANIATPTTCNYSAISTAGDAAATAAGYNLAAYEFKVYMFPRVTSCGWSGLGYVGYPRLAYINGPSAFITKVVGHEMGHNFGLLHAASLDCGARSVGGACTASEYGDPFNTMGNATSMHFAAAQKSLLGWLPSTSVKTHTSGSATYVINPLETVGGTVYALKIPAATKRTYWLEYRQPIGFDAGLSAYPTNGAQIRVASPFETLCGGCTAGSDDTELLDLTTGTVPFTDAALTVGKSYTDPDYGITINVISATATALTVQVSGPGTTTTPVATTTTIASSANPSSWQSSVTFTATVSGSAPTGTVVFSDGATAVAGCTAVALVGSGNARTATCATAALAVGTHTITAKYAGDAANTTSTSPGLAQSVTSTTTTTVTNVALASAGGSATASSTLSGYSPSLLINGDGAGLRFNGGPGWWTDATPSVFPDWVQIQLKASKSVSQVVVYSLQDNYNSPITPTATTTFSLYGARDFTVQGWNGSAWVTLASVTGNNLVKRTLSFTAFTTDKIRVNVTKSANAYTRLTEVEVWGK
jgi:hypothetical protein